MNLKAKILALDDAKLLPVEVPEWDTTVYLRVLSGAERSSIDARAKQLEKAGRPGDIAAFMVALTACEANGQRIFSDADVEALNNKNGLVLDRLALAAAEHNGIGQAAVDAAKKN